jgi:hypothetical protein
LALLLLHAPHPNCFAGFQMLAVLPLWLFSLIVSTSQIQQHPHWQQIVLLQSTVLKQRGRLNALKEWFENCIA